MTGMKSIDLHHDTRITGCVIPEAAASTGHMITGAMTINSMPRGVTGKALETAAGTGGKEDKV